MQRIHLAKNEAPDVVGAYATKLPDGDAAVLWIHLLREPVMETMATRVVYVTAVMESSCTEHGIAPAEHLLSKHKLRHFESPIAAMRHIREEFEQAQEWQALRKEERADWEAAQL